MSTERPQKWLEIRTRSRCWSARNQKHQVSSILEEREHGLRSRWLSWMLCQCRTWEGMHVPMGTNSPPLTFRPDLCTSPDICSALKVAGRRRCGLAITVGGTWEMVPFPYPRQTSLINHSTPPFVPGEYWGLQESNCSRHTWSKRFPLSLALGNELRSLS